MNGIQLIEKERSRQMTQEGWTPEHDDQHTGGELAQAAATYAIWTEDVEELAQRRLAKTIWPWQDWSQDGMDWFKPSDPIRNLVKAGALIAAEIDRLQRLQSSQPVDPKS